MILIFRPILLGGSFQRSKLQSVPKLCLVSVACIVQQSSSQPSGAYYQFCHLVIRIFGPGTIVLDWCPFSRFGSLLIVFGDGATSRQPADNQDFVSNCFLLASALLVDKPTQADTCFCFALRSLALLFASFSRWFCIRISLTFLAICLWIFFDFVDIMPSQGNKSPLVPPPKSHSSLRKRTVKSPSSPLKTTRTSVPVQMRTSQSTNSQSEDHREESDLPY